MKNNRKKSERCTHIKANGEQCRAIANKKTRLCSVHSGLVPRLGTNIDPDKGVVHVKGYLARLMIDTKRGKVKPQVANSIANLADKLLKCHDKLELEAKIDRLLEELREKPRTYTVPDADCVAPPPENRELPGGNDGEKT